MNQRMFQDPPGALARKPTPAPTGAEAPADVEVVYEEEKPKTMSVPFTNSKTYTTAVGTIASLYASIRAEAQKISLKNLSNTNPKNAMMFILLLCVILEVFMKSHGANSPYINADNTDDKRDLASASNFVSKLPQNSPLLSKEVGKEVGKAVSSVPANTKTAPPAPANDDNNNDNKPQTRLERVMAENSPNRKIVYVHTGKAGGEALRTNVAAKCNDYYPNFHSDENQKKLHLECQGRFPPTNKLAHQTRHVFHQQWYSAPALEDATSFLFGLRNPMERIHEVYRYTHPANCRKTLKNPAEKNFGCWALDHGRMEAGELYYKAWKECFPSPNMEDFAQALLPPYDTKPNPHFIAKGMTHEQQTECRQLARDLVMGDKPALAPAAPHMRYNYKYYADNTMYKHKGKELFVLRQEKEYDDMIFIDKAMGGTGVFAHAKDKIPSDGSQHYMPSTLSDEAMHKLCCVLEDEIRYYYYIFDGAANLTPHDRGPTAEAMRHQCGIPRETSWTDWMHDCEQKKANKVE